MSGLLIFMVKDFTTSQFTGFNCRENIINKRSHSLMPLWPSNEKDKEMSKKRQEGSEPLLLKNLISHSLSYGFQATSSIPFKVHLNEVCVFVCVEGEGRRERNRERNVEGIRRYGLTICCPHQHLFISFKIYC